MTEQENCGKCSQRNGCRQAYQRMAEYGGPSVLGKVCFGLVVPLLSFVVLAAVFNYLAAGWLGERFLAVFSASMAVVGTALIMLSIFAASKFIKNRRN